MADAGHMVVVGRAGGRAQPPRIATPVGASHSFDPGADGVAGIYAARVLERGVDPRALCAEIRADRLGGGDRESRRRALRSGPRVTRFGRGTSRHLAAVGPAASTPASRPTPTTTRIVSDPAAEQETGSTRRPRQLAAAGLLALLLFPLGILLAHAQETPVQARYIVQPGDTLEGVAAEFGVDPAAILAASALQNPPSLTVAEVIVIPDAGESPEGAAANASFRQGSSPFVVGAHAVAPG